MSLGFLKSFKIMPGMRLSIGLSGISASVRRCGASVHIGKRGVYGHLGTPGPGISYRQKLTRTSREDNIPSTAQQKSDLLFAAALFAWACLSFAAAIVAESFILFILIILSGLVALILKNIARSSSIEQTHPSTIPGDHRTNLSLLVQESLAAVPSLPAVSIEEAVPAELPAGVRHFFTRLAGVTVHNRDGVNRQTLLRRQRDEMCLTKYGRATPKFIFDHEEDNPSDPNAITVLTEAGEQIGYISRELAKDIAAKAKLGYKYVVLMDDITGGDDEKQTLGINILIIEVQPGLGDDVAQQYLTGILPQL